MGAGQGESNSKTSYSNRSQLQLLVICPNGLLSSQVRQALKSLGYANISTAPTHVQGFDRIRTRNYHYVLFDAVPSDMPTKEFVEGVVEIDKNAILVPVSSNPQIDDVFGLLQSGARGYLVTPFTMETLEDVLERAKDGPPLSENVLKAPDRNAALVNALLNNLCKVAVLLRQSKHFPTAEQDSVRYKGALGEASELARMFCESGNYDSLRDKIIDVCISRSNQAATRLGRTRKKLAKERHAEVSPALGKEEE